MKKPTSVSRGKAPAKRRGKSREELNQEARDRKRQKKRRGNPPGSRMNIGGASLDIKNQSPPKDPRTGSKKPIPLGVSGRQIDRRQQPDSGKTVLSPQDELNMLENDERLDRLLDRLEEGETLQAEEQRWLDARLERIDELMRLSGLSFDDEDEENEEQDQQDIMRLLKGGE